MNNLKEIKAAFTNFILFRPVSRYKEDIVFFLFYKVLNFVNFLLWLCVIFISMYLSTIKRGLFIGYHCESGIFFFNWRVTWNSVTVPLTNKKTVLGKFNEWTHLPSTNSNQSITFFKLIVLETNRPNTRINPWCLVNCLFKNFNYFFFSFYLLSWFASVLLIFFRNI